MKEQSFLQRWDKEWKCYVHIDSLEEVVAGDRLTAARRPEKLEDRSIDLEPVSGVYIAICRANSYTVYTGVYQGLIQK